MFPKWKVRNTFLGLAAVTNLGLNLPRTSNSSLKYSTMAQMQ
jgi:hypothetical protein